MRVFLATRTGSGNGFVYDLDPADQYTSLEGELVTTGYQDDPIRADADLTGAGMAITKPITARGKDYFFCIAADLDDNPTGTLDLGDPLDPASLDVAPGAGALAQLEAFFSLTPGVLDGKTRRDIIKWCHNDMLRFRFRIKRALQNWDEITVYEEAS